MLHISRISGVIKVRAFRPSLLSTQQLVDLCLGPHAGAVYIAPVTARNFDFCNLLSSILPTLYLTPRHQNVDLVNMGLINMI